MKTDRKLNIALTIVSIMVIGVSGTLAWRYLKGRRKLGGKIDDKDLPRNFAEIPGGKGNYRSDQPTIQEFEYIFKKFPKIKNVIRNKKGILNTHRAENPRKEAQKETRRK